MNIIIFDTETIGKISQDLLNVGYQIVDLDIRDGKYTTLIKRDYLVSKLINNRVYCINDDFVGAAKYEQYIQMLDNKSIIKRSLKQIYKTLNNDIKRYGVLFGYAYNCDFDLDKFRKHCPDGCINPLDTLPVFDIWAYAVNYIAKKEDYKKWCLENGQLTQTKRYLSTSVESITRYLKNDLAFEEDHTALSDVHWETEILLECVKCGCDITRPQDKKGRFISSGKKFNEILEINGKRLEINYTNKYTRNGVTYYK